MKFSDSGIKINRDRVHRRIDQLSQIGRTEDDAMHRLALSTEDGEARDLLSTWMRELHLNIEIDRIGNMFGVLSGRGEENFGVGSHLDSVPYGGFYDGALGVVAALETAEVIKEHDLEINKNLVVCNFTNEEGARFTPGMMGSKAHAHPQTTSQFLKASDDQGITVDEALQDIDYKGAMKTGSIKLDYFLEIHIEQGPVLEQENIDIGIVEGVQAIRWMQLTICGSANHAGTTPIPMRKDAFYALSKLSLFARILCKEYEPLVITIGSINVKPNTVNIIPGEVVATLDIRHPDTTVCKHVYQKIEQYIRDNEAFEGLESTREMLTDVSAVRFEQNLVSKAEESVKSLGYSSKRMYSGAGHDAQLLSHNSKAAMFFIPSKNGVSHSKEEFSSKMHIERGCQSVLQTVLSECT